LDSAELYDPTNGHWIATGSMTTARDGHHTATLLPNGQVLAAGGLGADGVTTLASAELYDPATGLWRTTGSMVTPRSIHTATLLPNGQVLLAGGLNGNIYLAHAELYDPATGVWMATADMLTARCRHTATLLESGEVLVAGGVRNGGTLRGAELYTSN
jgi:hypothetical protein